MMGLGASIFIGDVYAYPNMGKTIREVKQKATAKRQDDGTRVLIGDVKDGGTTAVGKSIANIILDNESGQSSEAGYKPPGLLGSSKCAADTCCVWWYISQVLSVTFLGPSGRCNALARAAIRLGFHDAGTWSQPLADSDMDFGGADGSIILSKTEINRPENNGLQVIAGTIGGLQKQFGVGMGDLIQFAAKHAVVSRFFQRMQLHRRMTDIAQHALLVHVSALSSAARTAAKQRQTVSYRA
jgi:hypothetical protein